MRKIYKLPLFLSFVTLASAKNATAWEWEDIGVIAIHTAQLVKKPLCFAATTGATYATLSALGIPYPELRLIESVSLGSMFTRMLFKKY